MTDYENTFESLRKACEDFEDRSDGFLDTYYNDRLKRILVEINHFLTVRYSSFALMTYSNFDHSRCRTSWNLVRMHVLTIQRVSSNYLTLVFSFHTYTRALQ